MGVGGAQNKSALTLPVNAFNMFVLLRQRLSFLSTNSPDIIHTSFSIHLEDNLERFLLKIYMYSFRVYIFY